MENAENETSQNTNDNKITESRPDESHDARPKSPAANDLISRYSTFNRYPQYVFPSLYNFECHSLDEFHEIPYAFSHHHGAFFWTREDACNGLYWNIFARPPCLNCICEGEEQARECDRGMRQHDSEGQTRCCSHCETLGPGEDVCVEMIEVRINPTSMSGTLFEGDNLREDDFDTLLDPLTAKYKKPATREFRYNAEGVDKFIWTPSEVLLRSKGKVFWTPINLQLSNTAVTDKLIHLYESKKTMPTTWNGANIAYLHDIEDEDARVWRGVREMMREKVQTWDAEEAKQNYARHFAARLEYGYGAYANLDDDLDFFAENQRYERALQQALTEQHWHSNMPTPPPPPPETAALSLAKGPAEAEPDLPISKTAVQAGNENEAPSESSSQGQHSEQHQTQPQPDNNLAALISQTLLLLTTRFLQKTQLPKTQPTSPSLSPPLPPIIPPENAANWPSQCPAVLAAAATYLTLKSNYMQAGETEEFACWEAGRDMVVMEREWIEELAPEVFEVGYDHGCGASDDGDGGGDWDGLGEGDEEDEEDEEEDEEDEEDEEEDEEDEEEDEEDEEDEE